MAKMRRPATTARRREAPRRARALKVGIHLTMPGGQIALRWPAPGSDALRGLQHDAMEWTHVVRNRARWTGTPALAAQQDVNARALLGKIGIDDKSRQLIAQAGRVRVNIPFTTEEIGWEARILPWEFLLSAGTRDLRRGPLIVTRALLRARSERTSSYGKALFVESAPGVLAENWDFASEQRLVRRYTKATEFEALASPTRGELDLKAKAQKPDVVHLAGFDTHQGLELLRDPRVEKTIDGYLMALGGGVDPVSAADLAEILTPATAPPSLVFCNIWNSAARIAPLLVARGAQSAIGFQDGMDDALAEMFVGSFYRSLARTKDVEVAFADAWAALQTQPKSLRGSGIVLWLGGEAQATSVPEAHTTPPASESQPLLPSDVPAGHAGEMLAVTVEPEPQFSYGLLHNNRDLFRRFLIRNLSDRPVRGVDVFVELHSNDGTYPYRQSFALEEPVLDLTRQIRIALTSTLARTLDEVLRTSLYVAVTWGAHDIFRETFPVTMAPVDQWADTDADRIFLPSFVFPRDRAVGAIIKNAEQFMTALRDDPTAGFDGYQAVDPDLDNPAQHVDGQVQAIWYSCVYKVPASYINPPPTYAVSSQRIRTPSEVVTGGFGTCIDLALMVASSLEAVEIHPVIFLLNDHAFPGYWRTDTARDAFMNRVAASASNPGTAVNAIRGDGGSAKKQPGAPWCFDAAALVEIRRAIDRNQLVPLESVGLTGRSSFGDAATDGQSYFEPGEADRFLMMLDVRTARERGVTPLPLGPRLQ